MDGRAESHLRIFDHNHGVSFCDGFITVKFNHRWADEMFGHQRWAAHALRAFYEISKQPFKPGDLNGAICME